ncbi:T9SS type A sorting domain-containing protein [Winogradskyella helgolandensis]|uniref:T9SS type A sorting domain-containing protein n=1 Tax=Winogradskyella helgolandensis TaxID=2697010 RepID=UPI0015C0D470|nr:T9SS type A sorting domain-containing protein [Winogradskyella helgolandensis]
MKQKLLLFFIGTCIAFLTTHKTSAQCDIISADYYQDFTTIPAECWEEANGGDATTGPTSIGSGSWSEDGFLNNGTVGAFKINLFLNSKSDWLLSPDFDLSGGGFQVDFDFGIMDWSSSTVAGTLGSDDTIQLLITTDNGATWTTLLTYDENSSVSVSGEHPVVDLSAYTGLNVQFGILGSEGLVDDQEDVDVFIDNFRVRSLVTCVEPIELFATSESLNSAVISWTETGTATSWNIEYGIEGFELGTGVFVAEVTSNPYVITGLLPDTSYQFHLQSICGPGDESSWSTPYQLFFGYCESVPPSNDGEGVGNVTIGNTDFPSLGDLTYENQTTNAVNVYQGLNNTVIIDYEHSLSYYTNIWIDFNDDFTFDSSELVFQDSSTGVTNPHSIEASFLVPSTATIGEHRMRIGTADTGQASPNPCYSESWGVTLDFIVNVQQLNCTQPEANYTLNLDCDADVFYVDVNITNLGDATSLEISNNFDLAKLQVTELGLYQVGPFSFESSVKVFVTNEQDNNCTISSNLFDVDGCPPANDECETATPVIVNDALSCDIVASGTIFLATDSGVLNDNCIGVPNDDVWFSFTALGEAQIISILNMEGGTTDLDFTLYEGACGTLTELSCTQSTSANVQNLTIGNNYYVRVFSRIDTSETTTFDLCIREASSNLICENAVPFCSDGTEFTTSNTIGIPSSYSMSCLTSTPNPSWNSLQIDNSGAIEIEISQLSTEGTNLDVDFVLFGPFDSVEYVCDEIVEGCTTCQNIIDCSYSASSVENFTITNALSDEIYILLTTNYSGQEGTTYISQTNFGQPDSGSLKADFEIDLGPDQNLCDVDAYEINAASQYADSYQWFLNGFAISGEVSATLTVTEPGDYGVAVFNDLCSSQVYEEITITFNNCEDVGLINVTAFYDDNENTVYEANEFSFSNGYFTYEANNDGVINTVASSTGSFSIASYEDTDTFDINYYFYDEYSDCYDVSIASFQDVTVLNGETIAVEFPIVDEQSCEDISVYLINEQSPRPGFAHTNYLIIQNLGLTPTSGTINYSLDSNLSISNISTNSNYTTTLNANGFSLDFVNLLPQQTIIVNVNLQTATSANLGDLVATTATYTTSSNDIVSENNESSVTEEIIGSYDPNDKMESHGKAVLFENFVTSDEYLYYTIRFQNVGTAEAITVRIEDVLDTQLDESTFHMLRSSHNYVVTRTDRNLEWNFDNINLPAEQDDEEGSNGYVYFKIKPNAGYAIGDIIENTAAIYFDFNEPIITNTFQTEFVETLSVNGFDSTSFSLFPNPAKENVTIQLASTNFETGSVNIYNIQGKAILKPVNFEGNSSILDISSLESGLYFVELTIGNTSTVQKLIVN